MSKLSRKKIINEKTELRLRKRLLNRVVFFQSILFQNSSRRQEFFFRISFQKKKFWQEFFFFAFPFKKKVYPGFCIFSGESMRTWGGETLIDKLLCRVMFDGSNWLESTVYVSCLPFRYYVWTYNFNKRGCGYLLHSWSWNLIETPKLSNHFVRVIACQCAITW